MSKYTHNFNFDLAFADGFDTEAMFESLGTEDLYPQEIKATESSLKEKVGGVMSSVIETLNSKLTQYVGVGIQDYTFDVELQTEPYVNFVLNIKLAATGDVEFTETVSLDIKRELWEALSAIRFSHIIPTKVGNKYVVELEVM